MGLRSKIGLKSKTLQDNRPLTVSHTWSSEGHGFLSLHKKLGNSEEMVAIHRGVSLLPTEILSQQPQSDVIKKILELESGEYKETLSQQLKTSAGLGGSFLSAAINYGEEKEEEYKKTRRATIEDVQDAYDTLLEPYSGKILLLFDEAGSIDKSFFRPRDGGASFFETLMNQLRTISYVRTKIAVYPHSHSDILRETRYGDVIELQSNVEDKGEHLKFRKRVYQLINNYISKSLEKRDVDESVLFGESLDLDGGGDILEQLIYASGGNLRTFVHLLDLSMLEAFEDHAGSSSTRLEHAFSAIRKYARNLEGLFTETEVQFLDMLTKSCKDRGTYRFQFPNMSPILSKYTSKSSEINILKILEVGTGRKGTTYAFDYNYCIYKDIPTHYIKNTQKIDKSRSYTTGQWIKRVQKLSDEILHHASIENKVIGIIDFVHKGAAFVTYEGEDGDFFLSSSSIIEADRKKFLVEGKRVRFYPATLPDGSRVALAAEVLD